MAMNVDDVMDEREVVSGEISLQLLLPDACFSGCSAGLGHTFSVDECMICFNKTAVRVSHLSLLLHQDLSH
jgi:hypothetical protein